MIERIFRILKKKYRILKSAPEYDIDTQIDLIFGLTALHNFYRMRGDGREFDDHLERIYDQEEAAAVRSQPYGFQGEAESIQSNKVIDRKRDQMAEQMWQDYQRYIQDEEE